jgi:hypothetical protein
MCILIWRRRRLSRCTLRFHEIDDLEIARACGRDSWSHDKETSKRFGGQTNIALHG